MHRTRQNRFWDLPRFYRVPTWRVEWTLCCASGTRTTVRMYQKINYDAYLQISRWIKIHHRCSWSLSPKRLSAANNRREFANKVEFFEQVSVYQSPDSVLHWFRKLRKTVKDCYQRENITLIVILSTGTCRWTIYSSKTRSTLHRFDSFEKQSLLS